MNKKINFKNLIDKKLSVSHRILNMECFHFGELKRIGGGSVGEVALHVQCEWRIIAKKILVGSKDLDYNTNGEYDADIDWDTQTLRDIKLQNIIKNYNLFVKNVEVDIYGGLIIYFENNVILEIIPFTSSMVDEYTEFWRILIPNSKQKHLVSSPDGLMHI